MWIHDRNNFVVSHSSIYGSNKIDIFPSSVHGNEENDTDFEQTWNPNEFIYSVSPTETIFINEENNNCLSVKETEDENIKQCLDSYLDSQMNCTLPWRSKYTSTNNLY